MGSVTAQTQSIVNFTMLLLSFLLIIVIVMDYKAGMFSIPENIVGPYLST
mgnify:CR=1 FL=1